MKVLLASAICSEIWGQGARIHVRKCNSKIMEFYRKLKRKGKHENVAIIGC